MLLPRKVSHLPRQTFKIQPNMKTYADKVPSCWLNIDDNPCGTSSSILQSCWKLGPETSAHQTPNYKLKELTGSILMSLGINQLGFKHLEHKEKVIWTLPGHWPEIEIDYFGGYPKVWSFFFSSLWFAVKEDYGNSKFAANLSKKPYVSTVHQRWWFFPQLFLTSSSVLHEAIQDV